MTWQVCAVVRDITCLLREGLTVSKLCSNSHLQRWAIELWRSDGRKWARIPRLAGEPSGRGSSQRSRNPLLKPLCTLRIQRVYRCAIR